MTLLREMEIISKARQLIKELGFFILANDGYLEIGHEENFMGLKIKIIGIATLDDIVKVAQIIDENIKPANYYYKVTII